MSMYVLFAAAYAVILVVVSGYAYYAGTKRAAKICANEVMKVLSTLPPEMEGAFFKVATDKAGKLKGKGQA